MIFEDVFPKLKALRNGPALKGQDAKDWDTMALSQEQNLIHVILVIFFTAVSYQISNFTIIIIL